MERRIRPTLMGRLALRQAHRLDEEILEDAISSIKQAYLSELNQDRRGDVDRDIFSESYIEGMRDVLKIIRENIDPNCTEPLEGYVKGIHDALKVIDGNGYLLGKSFGSFEKRLLEYIEHLKSDS